MNFTVRYEDIVLPVLYTSCFLGLLHEWVDILHLQVWILWFLLHVFILSLFIIYQDVQLFQVTSKDRKHLLYNVIFATLWYYQRIYSVLYYPSGNFESSCKRDFLIIHSSLVLSLLVVAIGAVFVGLVHWQ